jgi:hypothetical protein
MCPGQQSISLAYTLDPTIMFLVGVPVLGPLVSAHLLRYRHDIGTYRVQIQPNQSVCNGVPEKYRAVLLNPLR